MNTYSSFDGTYKAKSKVINFIDGTKISKNLVPRGNGLSPRLLSVENNGISITVKKDFPLMEFDTLENTVKVHACYTFADINKEAFKYGLELPVIGYSSIQIGSGIAGCIHGKNHFLYDFGQQVLTIEILLYDNNIVECSLLKNKEIFNLTLGGLGSTGLILSAVIKLKKITSTSIQRSRIRLNSSADFIKEYTDTDNSNLNGIFGWHNLHPVVNNFDSGYVYKDNYINEDKFMPESYPVKPAHTYNPSKIYTNGGILFGKLFNTVYFLKELVGKNKSIFNAYSEAIASKNLYWSIMRRNGFIETQFLVPYAYYIPFIKQIQILLKKYNATTSVCISKPASGFKKYLRFTGNGINIDITGIYNKNNYLFFNELNLLSHKYDAIPNILKCSILDKSTIEKNFGNEFHLFFEDYRNIFNSEPPIWFLKNGFLDKY
jgi:hypothetical protein